MTDSVKPPSGRARAQGARRKSTSARAVKDPVRARTQLRITIMVIVLAGLVAGELVRRTGGAVDGRIAPELLGLWTTNDQRYGDRALHITEDSLTLTLGDGGGIVTYPIERVTSRRIENATSYVVEYVDLREDVSYKLPFVHRDGGILQIANQDGVQWTRGATAVVRTQKPDTGEHRITPLSPLSDLMVICIKDATSRGQAVGTVKCVPADSS